VTSRLRLVLATGLALLSLACAGVLVWVLAFDGGRDNGSGGLEEPEARERAMSLGDQFVRRLGTYGPDLLDESGQMPDYRERMREVITPKFRSGFDKQVAAVEQLVAQAGVERSTEVFATAVSRIDDDNAQLLVAGAFNDTYTAAPAKGSDEERTVSQEPLPFRFTVDLVSVDGDWLVDDFAPVGGADPLEGESP
jgi:Mce-associated membrane protein